MNKKLRIPILPIFLLSIFLSFLVSKNISAEITNNNVHLVLDSSSYNDILPKNFRKTTDLTTIKDNKNLNLNGLDKLNISGSQQFSENNLPLLIKGIDTSLPITVVDLRQESHGFINGLPVSWADSKNNANVGLTREQVLLDESNKLKSITLNKPITFYNNPKLTIVPTKVQNEEELVKSKDLSYNRITVRDGGIPNDDMVDYFIESIKAQPQKSWLHFHCKQGIGRTTTFMVMYDMIKNYKEVSADEIIKRQLSLANFNENTTKSFYNNERIDFLNKFYNYCKINGDSFQTKWSEWKKSSATNSSATFSAMKISNLYSNFIKNSMTPSERTMVASLQGLTTIVLFKYIHLILIFDST